MADRHLSPQSWVQPLTSCNSWCSASVLIHAHRVVGGHSVMRDVGQWCEISLCNEVIVSVANSRSMRRKVSCFRLNDCIEANCVHMK